MMPSTATSPRYVHNSEPIATPDVSRGDEEIEAMAMPDYSRRALGEIAASMPGATAVFRRHKLDFFCGGKATLEEAAAKAGLDVEALTSELAAIRDHGEAAPEETGALIEHIVQRYHSAHRRELPELILLAGEVESKHAGNPRAPTGLAVWLEGIASTMEPHFRKEENVLFPMMRRAVERAIREPIEVMRHEHEAHGDRLWTLVALCNNFDPPPEACDRWRALYVGLGKFVNDLMTHLHLEDNVLFPRFDP
jgi:regulator of cell morphogenesis and NO signaling